MDKVDRVVPVDFPIPIPSVSITAVAKPALLSTPVSVRCLQINAGSSACGILRRVSPRETS